jgi:hypothetical protein
MARDGPRYLVVLVTPAMKRSAMLVILAVIWAFNMKAVTCGEGGWVAASFISYFIVAFSAAAGYVLGRRP